MSKEVIFPVSLTELSYKEKSVTLVGEIRVVPKEDMEAYGQNLINYFQFLNTTKPVLTEGTFVYPVSNIYSVAPNIANTTYSIIGENHAIVFEPAIFQGDWEAVAAMFTLMAHDQVPVAKPKLFSFS